MSRRQRRRTQQHTADGSGLSRISGSGWLLLGLALGLAGSLYYAWVVNPVVYTDASPARFSQEYRETYVLLVSQSYAQTGEWETAVSRLDALEDPALNQTVSTLLDKTIREQQPDRVIRNLAALARRLGVESVAVARFAPGTPVPATATPTSTALAPLATFTPTPTPQPTGTPTPTATATVRPSPTSQPTFRLLDQQRLCANEDTPRIEVITLDAFLNQQPGIEVIVQWQTGEDRFYTGFQPALGPGYGDFTMTPDTSYTVLLAEGSPEMSGLRIEPCDNGAQGGWQLTFQNLRFGATPTPEIEE